MHPITGVCGLFRATGPPSLLLTPVYKGIRMQITCLTFIPQISMRERKRQLPENACIGTHIFLKLSRRPHVIRVSDYECMNDVV